MPNAKGVLEATKSVGEAIIKAKWVPLGHSNRITPPDVVKNESVIIMKFGDTDEYYWTTIFREPMLRRLETVLYAFGNLAKGLVKWDKTSSYWFEVSTHDKYLHLKTTKSNGEAFEYDVKIDTDKSNLTIKDNIDNQIVLDSPSKTITLKQTEGSMVELSPRKVVVTDNSGVTLTLQNGVLTVSASTKIELISPETIVNGHLTVTNGISFGKGDGGAVAKINIPIESTEPIRTTAEISSDASVSAPALHGKTDCE